MTTSSFDAYSYLAANTDLIRAGLSAADAEWHYRTSGQKEGRSTNFNAIGYIAGSADLRAAFGTNTSTAAYHYVKSGYWEGRTVFDSNLYLASNPDLIAAGLQNPADAALHYIAYGAGEGRSTTSFNPANYAIANSDLYTAFGNGTSATSKGNLAQHYVSNGYREGRLTSPANWSGSGSISSATGYSELTLSVPAGRYQIEMFGASTGQGTLSDPYLDVGLNYIGHFTAVQNDNGGVGLNARAEITMYAATNNLSIRFRQSQLSSGNGGTFQYTIGILS